MKKIFLDTCVVLDHAFNRNYSKEMTSILDMNVQNTITCFVSIGTFYTIAYLIEHELKRKYPGRTIDDLLPEIRRYLSDYLRMFKVANISNAQIEKAINNNQMKDIEDSFQLETAKSVFCEYLVTSDRIFLQVKDPKIKIVTPTSLLKQIKIK